MSAPSHRQAFPPPASDRLILGAAAASAVAFATVVIVAALWTLDRIDVGMRESVRRSLTAVLATTRESAQHWATRQQALAITYASSPELARLMTATPGGGAEGQSPRPDSAAVAGLLEPVMRANGLSGYWIVSAEGTTLLRWPEQLPDPLPAELLGAVEKSLDGLPAVSPFSEIVAASPGAPRVCAVAPIRTADGRTAGALVLALPAERELAQLAEQSHIRTLGQTYFFDRTGRIVSASHDGPSVGRIARVFAADSARYTSLASELGQTLRAGITLDGYPDHRGVRVVAAWEWDDRLGLGVAREVAAVEAYHGRETARQALLVGAALSLLLFMVVVAGLVQARRRGSVVSALQRRLAAVLQVTTDPVVFAGASGGAFYLNDAGRGLLADQPERLLRPEALDAAARHGVWSGDLTITPADGRERTLSAVVLCHRGPGGAVDFYSAHARDISDRTQLERRLFEEKERAEVTLGSIGDGVVRTDARGVIEYLNPVAEQLLGIGSREAVGREITTLLCLVHESTREPLENPVSICLRERRVVGRANQSLMVRPDGREFAIDDSAAPVRDHAQRVTGAVMVFHDVSRARSLARQLAHQASHDFLTGLVNRHEFERRLARAITRSREEDISHAVCYLDLDQFKVVNDTCGHVAGDELLRQLATALQKKVRRRDTLARLGGDEFGVLLEHCPPGQAARVAHDLLETVQEFRFVWEGKPFQLGVSIGLVSIAGECEGLAAVLRDADAACYAAKERGRNRVHLYQPNDAVLAFRQGEMQWVSRITSALEENRFRLYGQTILPLAPRPGERVRVEVLLRLIERDGTVISPGAFIPAAERYGLMGAVDRWVVREVTGLYARHRSSGYKPIASINLSGASLGDPGMLAFLREQLARHHLPPETLCFEITETAAIANLAQAAHFIQELKAMGCWFALDDFGSGMSSFGYLQSLPVDSLKIAGTFLRHIETDPVARAMVEAINRVGHVMNLTTVAEGVETAETLAVLRTIGVDYAQGFAIAEPSPLEDQISLMIVPGLEAPPRAPTRASGWTRSRPASA